MTRRGQWYARTKTGRFELHCHGTRMAKLRNNRLKTGIPVVALLAKNGYSRPYFGAVLCFGSSTFCTACGRLRMRFTYKRPWSTSLYPGTISRWQTYRCGECHASDPEDLSLGIFRALLVELPAIKFSSVGAIGFGISGASRCTEACTAAVMNLFSYHEGCKSARISAMPSRGYKILPRISRQILL